MNFKTPAFLLYFAAFTAVFAQTPNSFASMNSGFIENRGQWNAAAKFSVQSPQLSLWLTSDGSIFDIPRADKKGDDVVRLRFVGSSPAALRGSRELGGEFNYFLNGRRTTDVRHYSEVQSGELYRGISARYYFDRGMPRYDLNVAPGADPSQIKMRFEGAKSVQFKNGKLNIQSAGGELQQTDLIAYQTEGSKRVTVTCSMVTQGKEAKFKLGNYDHSKVLTIDPLIFSTLTLFEVTSMKIDPNGNPVLYGHVDNGVDFPTQTGFVNYHGQGQYSGPFGVIAKFNGTTGALMDATVFQGYYNNTWGGDSFQLDSQGNYVFASSGFTPMNATEQSVPLWETQIVILSDHGKLLRALTTVPEINAIALDKNDNVFVAGTADPSLLPTTPGACSSHYVANSTYYLAELAPYLTKVSFCTYLDSTTIPAGSSAPVSLVPVHMLVSSDGSILVSGLSGQSYPLPSGAYQFPSKGANTEQYFVLARFSSDGSSLLNGVDIPNVANGFQNAGYISENSHGNVIAGFSFTISNENPYFPATGLQPTFPSPNGNPAAGPTYAAGYVAVMAHDMSSLLAATYLGGVLSEPQPYASSLPSGYSFLGGFAVDSSDNVCFTLETNCYDLPATTGSYLQQGPTSSGAFVGLLSSDLAQLKYGSYIGPSVSAYPVLDRSNNAFLAADFNEPSFPITVGPDFPAILDPSGLPGALENNTALVKLVPQASAVLTPQPTVTGGNSDSCVLTIPSAAPSGGLVVPITVVSKSLIQYGDSESISNPSAPQAVYIPAGQTSAKFLVGTTPVPSVAEVLVSAHFSSGYQSAKFKVLPTTVDPYPVVVNSATGYISVQINTTAPVTSFAGFQASSDNPIVSPVSNPWGPTTGTTRVYATFQVHQAPSSVTTVHLTLSSPYFPTKIVAVTLTPDFYGLYLDAPNQLIGGQTDRYSAGFAYYVINQPPSVSVSYTSSSPLVTFDTANQKLMTEPVASPTPVTLTASAEGVQVSTQIMLEPSTLISAGSMPLATATQAVQETVAFDGPVPDPGTPVALRSSNPGVLAVPSNLTIPVGSSAATFNSTAAWVANDTPVTITASAGGVTRTEIVTVKPLPGPVQVSPNAKVIGGLQDEVAVLFNQIPDQNQTLYLSTNDSTDAVVPTSIVWQAGSDISYIYVGTHPVSQSTVVTITAQRNGFKASGSFTILPAPLGIVSPSATTMPMLTSQKCRVGLNGLAGPGGAVVALSSSDPDLHVPASVTVPAGTNSGYFTLTAGASTTNMPATITATYLGVSRTATVSVSSSLAPVSLALSPNGQPAGVAFSGMVTFNQPLGSSGGTVNISCSNTSLVTVPSTVSCPAGATSCTFSGGGIKAVTSKTNVTITATVGGYGLSTTYTLLPTSLLAVSPTKTSLNSGQGTTCSLYLDGSAPAGGAVVSLSSNSSAATVPTTVTVPAGASKVIFNISAGTVSTATQVTITATYNGSNKTATITVNP